jgi:hypothetical protein
MKRCPTCNRTYASDEFTFCLDDGSLLSAPYDPQQSQPPTVRRSEPPPTEVLPADLNPTVPSPSLENERGRTPVIPTMAVPSPAPMPAPQKVNPIVFGQLNVPPRRAKFRLIYVVAPLLLIVLAFGALFFSASQCPSLTVYCSPGDNLAGCVLGGPSWHSVIVPKTVSWRTSSGRVSRVIGEGAVIDTTGFVGQEITVTANYSTWLCSTSASKSFIAK